MQPATDAPLDTPTPHPMPQATYELLDRTVAELPRGPQHLVVLSGVPVVFPTVRRRGQRRRLGPGQALPVAACTTAATPPTQVPLSETILGGLASMGRRMPRFANFCRSAGAWAA